MARRYSAKEKENILDFIMSFDAAHDGRGGQSQAVKKFGVSFLTLRTWLGRVRKKGKAAAGADQAAAAKRENAQPGIPKARILGHFNSIEKYTRRIEEIQRLIDAEKAEIRKLLG